MTTSDPEEIRSEIDQTRAALSQDVDALAYEANPAHMAQRQVSRAKRAGSAMLDRVFGSIDDAKESVGQRAGELGETAAGVPGALRQRAQGNPVAAGLVAFGAGLLVAAAFPPSRKERELAQTVKETAEPITEQVSEAAKAVGAGLAEPAKAAAESLKESATEAIEHVQTEATSAAGDVQLASAEASEDVRRKLKKGKKFKRAKKLGYSETASDYPATTDPGI